MPDSHTAKARRMFGDHAVVTRERASAFTGRGSLAGKCSTCLRPGCRRKWSITIGVVEMGGAMLVVKGRAHTYKEAWARAEHRQAP